MNKALWLKDSIAKADGYYSPKGEKLKGAKLDQAAINAWNGVKAAPAPAPAPVAPAPAPAPVVEEVKVADSIDLDGNGMLSQKEAELAVEKKSIFKSAFGK